MKEEGGVAQGIDGLTMSLEILLRWVQETGKDWQMIRREWRRIVAEAKAYQRL